MKRHWLFEQVCFNSIANDADSQIHKVNLTQSFREFPGKATIINNPLKHVPIGGINNGIFIEFPNEEAIINESFVKNQEVIKKLKNVFDFIYTNIHVCYGWRSSHAHGNANKLPNCDVTKVHSVVAHHNTNCLNQSFSWEL